MRLGKLWKGGRLESTTKEFDFGDQITVIVPPMGKVTGILGTPKFGRNSRWLIPTSSASVSIVSTLTDDVSHCVCIHEPTQGRVISCFYVLRISPNFSTKKGA